MLSRTGVYVDSTEEGILQGDIAEDVVTTDEDSGGEDSIIDENEEICRLERLDFQEEVELESDLEDNN